MDRLWRHLCRVRVQDCGKVLNQLAQHLDTTGDDAHRLLMLGLELAQFPTVEQVGVAVDEAQRRAQFVGDVLQYFGPEPVKLPLFLQRQRQGVRAFLFLGVQARVGEGHRRLTGEDREQGQVRLTECVGLIVLHVHHARDFVATDHRHVQG